MILEAISPAKAICKEQKETENCEYRLTTLCVCDKCEDGVLLYHTLTGELLLLEHEREWEECKAALIKKRFLVPENFNEPNYADSVLKIAKLLNAAKKQESRIDYFTILTTTACNARCYYCYEEGVKTQTMSKETAQDVAEHIISASGGKDVKLHWFGGEPLINSAVIDIICGRLTEQGIAFTSNMVSNGYFLDGDTVQKAASLWNLTDVQITLDGTRDTYNKIKAYVDGGDAYTRVLNNIESARKAGITVSIRLNVGRDNLSELMRLADSLAARFEHKQGLNAYASLIGDYKSGNGRFKPENGDAESYLKLVSKLRNVGFEIVNDSLKREFKLNCCMADNDSAEIIMPDGSLCRCDHALGGSAYGSIYKDSRDLSVINAWKEQIKLPQCYKCALYPRCVSLKKCALVNTNCDGSIQAVRIKTLECQVRDAYKKWKEHSYET